MAKNIGLAAGWVLAVVLGAMLLAQMQSLGAMRDKLAAAEGAAASVTEATEKIAALEAQCATLEAKLAELTAASAESAAVPAVSAEVPKGFDPKALFKSMLGAAKTEGAESEPSKNPFASMFEGEQGEKLMESMIPTQVEMQYSALFSELNLSDERKAALREVLLEHARAGARYGMAMMRGEATKDGDGPPSDEDLLTAVGEVLDPEELKQFTEYQEAMPERLLRQQYDMQIGMFAGDLPQEVRDRTVDVLVENVLASQPDGMNSGVMPNFESMRAAFDTSLATLEQEVAPEYLDRVRAVIQQQQAGIDLAASMFGGNEGEGEPPTAP
jgi:hypothetical protein